MNKKHILIIVCAAYVVGAGMFNYLLGEKKIRNFIDFYETYQNEMLDHLKTKFENMNAEDLNDAQYINDIFDLQHSYGFVYKDNMVVFEKDMETTLKYKNSTARELFNDYSQASGKNSFGNIKDILFEESGTLVWIKSDDIGEELISWDSVTNNGSVYIVGLATPISEIENISDYNTYRNVDICFYIISSALLCFAAFQSTKK